MPPWNSLPPDLVITLTTPPVLRPYSAWYPEVLTSTSWMNSLLMSLPWMPLMTFVVLTPSIRKLFSDDVEPYTEMPPPPAIIGMPPDGDRPCDSPLSSWTPG